MAEWQKPFPKQHLVTKDQSSDPVSQMTPDQPLDYEDIIVFSLKATIAAFHVDPKTFLEDQKRLEKYFSAHALSQIEQTLYAATGSGILDHCILSQKNCDAITRSPAIIEKATPHFLQVRLPMITQDQQKLDVILSIQTQNLQVSDFAIERLS